MNFCGLTFACIIGTLSFRPAFSVSFYGESYIQIPIHDAFDKTDLELRFKTTRPYGLIALVAGETDYFLLQLHSGTLRLTLNFGSEETLVDLGQGRFDDLKWHNVRVTYEHDRIFLTVDNQTVNSDRKGALTTLNIDHGIYLGGIDGNFKQDYLDGIKFFRGCISYAKFGSYDLLEKAKEITDPAKLFEISWEVDNIFDASRDSDVSFLSDTSFISFTHLHPTKERTVSFLIQTHSQTALLLFSSLRHSTTRHYIALEIINGVLILTVCKHDEIVHAISEIYISDNEWHQIDIALSDSSTELSVDGQSLVKEFENKTTVPFGGLLFLGGINQKARAVALRERLESLKGENNMKGAVKGCIKNVIINSRAYGIHDIHSSRLIGTECEKTLCVTENCRSVENVEYESVDKIQSGTMPISDSNSIDKQILSVNTLLVEEGGRAILTSENIEIVYNYQKYGIRESGILLRIIDVPKHGLLEIDLGRRRSNDVFTYLDLIGQKVSYISDGTEERYDEIAMELEMVGSDDKIPLNLRKRYSFVLPINITPINDPPKILLQNRGILRIIENTKIRITSEFLNADDPDSKPSDLKYIIDSPPSKGYFEKVGQIGTPILEFTQQEINDRQIWFLHLGSGNSYIHLKLNDGFASSNMADITIQTVQLYLTVIKNSGLILPVGSSVIISNSNLSTISNVPTQELEIRYEVFRRPRYGILERQQYTNGEWRPVSVFAQRHVDQGHIRYRQADPATMPSSDQFSFMVKAKSYTTPPYTFRIQFEQLYLQVERNNKLVLLHQPFGVVSDENLKSKTNNPHTRQDSIKYTILRPPSLGDFYRIDRQENPHTDLKKSKFLPKDSIFTQADIDNKMIYYKLRESSFDKVQDFADIRVHSLSTSAKILRFWIEFVPMKSDVRFTNNGLQDVIEGGQKTIDRRSLYIQTDAFSVFEYTVISPPQHGKLQFVDSRSSIVLETGVVKFTNEDIKDLKLVYKHDDTETDKDSFSFMAIPLRERNVPSQSEIPEFTGTFEIHMLMRNDNPPVRLIDKVFKVVREKEKLITIEDLAFTDPDINYDQNELKYRLERIANGEIIYVVNKSKIEEFKQKDIIDKKVMFKHHGEIHGRAVLIVTDGQFYMTSSFEVQAGDPFIQIITNTGAIVRRDQHVEITTGNLSVETNVNVDDEGLRFVLIEEPRQGHLEIGNREVIEFTYKDIKDNTLSYKHEGGIQAEDQFKFAIITDAAQTQGSFSIQIVQKSSQQQPRVQNNHVLEVFGNDRTIIDQTVLLITHPDSSAENIEYLILVLPKQGMLYRNSMPLTLDDSTFTQLDINQGRVGYILRNDSATTDQFIFEVTNGFQTLRGLEFLIDVVPSILPIEVHNISVREGERKVIKSNDIKTGKIDPRKLVRFTIIDQPSHGMLEFSNRRSEAISAFTSEDLHKGRVYYSHDDSEDPNDSFSIKAELEDGSKESEVTAIYVEVEGINDQAPRVVVNKGLQVWKGSMTQITSDLLNAYDLDTPPEELTYRISSPTNGHISLVTNTFKEIASFKQSWINGGQIVFVHSGANKGEFSFQVTDGFNNDELRIFRIEAKPLILTLNVNHPLDAYPNTAQPITAAHLLASTNDPNQSKPIIFTLTSKPQFGTIVTMMDGEPLEVTSFTQEEINNSQIFYDHGDSFSGWTQNDSITFTVNTLYADPVAQEMFEIIVSYGNLNAENKNQLIKIKPIEVDEGGEMILAKNSLDVSEFVKNLERLGKHVSLTYSLKDPPKNGKLLYRGKELVATKRFSQRNINSHHLIYKHDDSDTTFDTFNLTLHLRIEGQTDEDSEKETEFTLVLNVTIQPINDEQFKLLTPNPSIHIVQGFSKILDNSILKTVDKDTEPEYLEYTISRNPSNGYITYIEFPTSRITKFTQKDIDEKRIMFQHDGSSDSGSFPFKITDGVFRPSYKIFNINVEQIYMNITHNATVSLLQSETTVIISQKNLNISTNGLRENVTYIVSRTPKFGKVMLKGKEVRSFTQSQIDQSLVTYIQTDMCCGQDSFNCDIFYRPLDIKYEDKVINVQVRPFVEFGPLEAPLGEKVALTRLSLDASKLAEVTADNPDYLITKGPFFGRIVRRMFSKRQVYHETSRHGPSYGETKEFSHEDVVYMKIFYEVFSDRVVAKEDNFTFILTAFTAQPAEGVFYIKLSPSDISPEYPVSKSPGIDFEPVTRKPVIGSKGKEYDNGINPGKSSVGDEAKPSSVKNDRILLVIAIVVPILVLLLLVILIVFIIWKRRRKRDYSPPNKKSAHMRPTISGPFQIDQPHVHIEPQRSPTSDLEETTLVEYQNTSNMQLGGSRAPSEERDIVMPMISRHEPHNIPRSPDISRTEISSTVPNCKVTPLIGNDDIDDDETSTDENRLSCDSMSDMFDWITSDPELLQHCRSSPPVLRKNQYWV